MLKSLRGLVSGEGLRAHLVRGAGGSVAIAGSAQILSLGSAIILARVLGPSNYGIYAFALASVELLQIPASFGVDQLLAREIAANEASGRWGLARGLLWRSVQLVSFSTIFVAAVTLVVLWMLKLHVSQEARLTLSVAVGFLVVNAYGRVASSTLLGLRRVIIAQVPMGVGRPALFLAGVVGVWWAAGGDLDPQVAMGVNVAAGALMLAVLTVISGRAFYSRSAGATPTFETRRWLASAFPFALMGGLAVINSRTDLVMLGMLASAHDVGVYRVAVSGAALIPMVLGAVNMAVGPTMSALYSIGDRSRLARIVRLTGLAGLGGCLFTSLVFLVWGHGLIRLVFGTAYALAWSPLMILAVGQTANAGAGPVGLVLNMTGHETDAFAGLAVAAVVNVALNGALIPSMGITGAAMATAISTVTWNVLMTWRVKRRLGFLPFGVELIRGLSGR